jgi:hypothetical protein
MITTPGDLITSLIGLLLYLFNCFLTSITMVTPFCFHAGNMSPVNLLAKYRKKDSPGLPFT